MKATPFRKSIRQCFIKQTETPQPLLRIYLMEWLKSKKRSNTHEDDIPHVIYNGEKIGHSKYIR